MPYFTYRAVGKGGQIVTNKIEDVSRYSVIAKLKRNGYLPISVVQNINRVTKSAKTFKKPARNIDKRIDQIKISDTIMKKGKKVTLKERVNLILQKTAPIKTRDIVIFTQNFYLLKKANFNNIHALTTIIGSTENLLLRTVLEDILAGVDSGETMYSTMEYYSSIFPYIYINMIKVGELSRIFNQFFRASGKIFRV